MALPTVHFHSAAAGISSSLLSVWMPKLQELLLDAGWTIEYADADAIGGGSSEAPAWDKSPVFNTDAGVAVYRMPANDHDTRWYVRLRPGWAANENRPHMRGVTIGTTHDGSGGISGAGSELAPSTASTQTDNRQVLIAASEDGFVFILPSASSGVHVLVERARRSDTGAVTDDIIALNTYSGVAAAFVRAGVGEVHTIPPIVLGGFGNGTSPASFGSSASLQNYDGSYIPVVGPFWVRGHPFWHGRLAFLVSSTDHATNSDRDLTIDGGSKTYRVVDTAHSTIWATWAVATE